MIQWVIDTWDSPWLYPLIISGVAALSGVGGVLISAWSVGRKKAVENQDVRLDRIRRAFQNLYLGMIIVDPDLRILEANEAAGRITGYGRELASMTVYDLLQAEKRPAHKEHVRRYFNDPRARRMGGGVKFQTFPMVNARGEVVNMAIALSHFENMYGKTEVVALMDVVQDA